MQSGLGGPLGYGSTALPRDDDGSHFRALGAVFPGGLRLGGQVWSGLWVNTNGTLAFGGPLAGYDAAAIAAAPGPVIAVFAADVDTRLRGEGVESGQIWLHEAPGVLTITWAGVGFFRRNTDLVNSFQVQIRAAGGADADVSLRYGAVDWVSGDLDGGSGGLGGAPALAGIKAGGAGAAFQPVAPSGDQAAWLALAPGTGWEIALRGGAATIAGADPGGGDPGGGDPGGGDPGGGDPGGGDPDPDTLSGSVRAPDGSPMPGVTLRLSAGAAPLAEAVTDAAGAFAFDLPADLPADGGPLHLEAARAYLPGVDPAPDILDVLGLFRLVAGSVPASAYDAAARLAADVDGNGTLNIFDVLGLFRHVAGVPGQPGPRFAFIEEGALDAGFGPDPLRVPPAAELPGIDAAALSGEAPLTLIAILTGELGI
jgi:hypothetical protein